MNSSSKIWDRHVEFWTAVVHLRMAVESSKKIDELFERAGFPREPTIKLKILPANYENYR